MDELRFFANCSRFPVGIAGPVLKSHGPSVISDFVARDGIPRYKMPNVKRTTKAAMNQMIIFF
jgi:hypothetical protein